MKRMICLWVATVLSLGSCVRQKVYTTQPSDEFSATLRISGVQLLDVRTAAEYAEGHIPGAVNMDVLRGDFERRIDTLDATRPVAIYCHSGARSRTAAKRFVARGYEVYELCGGILSWDGTLDR